MKYSLEINHRDSLDLISFFQRENSILFPPELLFVVVVSSLRMKHEVIILETTMAEFPQWDKTRRWQVSDNWCWLAPRSLSEITRAWKQQGLSYSEIKPILMNSK